MEFVRQDQFRPKNMKDSRSPMKRNVSGVSDRQSSLKGKSGVVISAH